MKVIIVTLITIPLSDTFNHLHSPPLQAFITPYLSRSSHTKRMANGYSTTIHIHLGVVNAQHIRTPEWDRCKGLIQFPAHHNHMCKYFTSYRHQTTSRIYYHTITAPFSPPPTYHKSMSSTVKPCLANSFGTAIVGPMPISSGAHPPTANPMKAPRGVRPVHVTNHI